MSLPLIFRYVCILRYKHTNDRQICPPHQPHQEEKQQEKDFIGSVLSSDLFNRSFCCIFAFFSCSIFSLKLCACTTFMLTRTYFFCNRRQQQRDFCYRIIFVALAISSIVGRQLTSQTFSTIIFLKG